MTLIGESIIQTLSSFNLLANSEASPSSNTHLLDLAATIQHTMKRPLVLGGLLAPLVSAQAAASTNPAAGQPTAAIDPSLVGTWTTGSRTVFTGPGFYDPVNDVMKEPSLPGISYSFTSDGFYEEAYYRAIANRK